MYRQGTAPLRRRPTASRDSRRSASRPCSTPKDASRRPSTPGTEEVMPADTVILAVGQQADVGFLGDTLERTRAGGIQIDGATLLTSHPRIWAGGDVGSRSAQPDRRHRRRPQRRGIHPCGAHRRPRHRVVTTCVSSCAPVFAVSTPTTTRSRASRFPWTPTERRFGFGEVDAPPGAPRQGRNLIGRVDRGQLGVATPKPLGQRGVPVGDLVGAARQHGDGRSSRSSSGATTPSGAPRCRPRSPRRPGAAGSRRWPAR